VTRGEVWWAELPNEGRRPVCILTRDEAIPVLSSLLVVPATRTVRGIATEIEIGPADGMPTACVLAFDNLWTVRKAHLVNRITQLSPIRMNEICVALGAAIDCQ
jgi:mRNA interferase MazF